MHPFITPRVIALGSVVFVGICLPLVFAHYSSESESRLPDWIPGLFAVGIAVFPAYLYVQRYRWQHSRSFTGESTFEAPLEALSPTLYTWIAVPFVFFLGGVLLGFLGFICYGVLANRKSSFSPAIRKNNQ